MSPRLFRVAAPAGAARYLAKTLAQILVVWSFALGFLPWVAVTVKDAVGVSRWRWPGQTGVGAALFALGSGVGLNSAWLMATLGRGTPMPFDAARELVVAGPYRIVRNPMAVSAIVQMIGVACILGSTATLFLAASVSISPGLRRRRGRGPSGSRRVLGPRRRG